MNDNVQKSIPPKASPADTHDAIRLGVWSFYFLVKLAAYWTGALDFHPLANLAFAAFLLMPVASRTGRWLRMAIALPAAVALLYYDSWLPPPNLLWPQLVMLFHFSFAYMFELARRVVSLSQVVALVLAWAAFRIISRYLRVGVVVVVLLIAVSLRQYIAVAPAPVAQAVAGNNRAATVAQPPSAAQTQHALNAALAKFYSNESQQRVEFTASPAGTAPFDVIFIHVCSLGWDDVRAVGLQNDPLWKRFDILFTKFNGATTYSGPAAIRVLRGACGQPSHAALYSPAPQGCYVMHDLHRAGFRLSFALNHNGKFGDFIGEVRNDGGVGDLRRIAGA